VRVRILKDPFDPWQALSDYQREHLTTRGRFGATAAFIGTMRDFNEDKSVERMTLEHYPGMTDKHLTEIATRAMQTHSLMDGLIMHRVGVLEPGEPIVLVGVWSAHRAAAFAACREIIEDLKARAPFWKKEQLPDRARWVERNTPG